MENQIVLLVILVAFGLFLKDKYGVPANEVAEPGEVSSNGMYLNSTPVKHDFFKLFMATSFLLWLYNDAGLPMMDFNNVNNSIIGRGLVTGLVFGLYNLYGEPLVNHLPRL